MLEETAHMTSLLIAAEACLSKRLPFALYRLPGSADTTLVLQRDPALTVLDEMVSGFPEKGFLIAPFSRGNGKTFLIRPDFLFRNAVSEQELHEIRKLSGGEDLIGDSQEPEDTLKEAYYSQIDAIVSGIEAGEFEKVVLSRVKSVKGSFLPKIIAIFNKLSTAYRDAFVYFFHVEGNCWTGATTEPLLCSEGDRLNTVSLAGTRSYSPENMDVSRWNQKEIQEQELVTRHIERVLHEFSVEDLHKKGPFTVRAGNLAHLCTDFTFSLPSESLPSLIASIHPTPAVCGMDSCRAFDFIRRTEAHYREYYTGFLGPVGLDESLQLFVNLRCMKVLKDRLVLYVGGGITLDSKAGEEWEETEMKAETLLSILRNLN